MIILSPAQKIVANGIHRWLTNSSKQECCVMGYAGTGKTTIINQLIQELEAKNRRVLVATYTGKAAHVLRTKGTPAHTIHSLAYAPIPDSSPLQFTLAYDSSPIRDVDLLVLDEISMINDQMADDLRLLAKRILVLGDPAQLPPIRGEGAFTRKTPDFFLDEIHRQALDSPILRLATRARQGLPINQTECPNTPEAQILRYSEQYILDHASTPHHQLICGTHKHRWHLTSLLRSHLITDNQDNPDLPLLPLRNEPIICLRNEREAGLYNGTTGTPITQPTPAAQPNLFRFTFRPDDSTTPEQPVISDDRAFREHQSKHPLPQNPATQRRGIQAFDFAYALTCHKAQGSEWSHVTILDDSAYFREHRHRWLYTGITRGQTTVTILRR